MKKVQHNGMSDIETSDDGTLCTVYYTAIYFSNIHLSFPKLYVQKGWEKF